MIKVSSMLGSRVVTFDDLPGAEPSFLSSRSCDFTLPGIESAESPLGDMVLTITSLALAALRRDVETATWSPAKEDDIWQAETYSASVDEVKKPNE